MLNKNDMKKQELKQFIDFVINQFNENKSSIILNYTDYFENADYGEYGPKMVSIEGWGVAMIDHHNKDMSHMPFRELYDFIEVVNQFRRDVPNDGLVKNSDCDIEFYGKLFLEMVDKINEEELRLPELEQ